MQNGVPALEGILVVSHKANCALTYEQLAGWKEELGACLEAVFSQQAQCF